jgi:DNA polymerase/3'-5' exonuclease PolX
MPASPRDSKEVAQDLAEQNANPYRISAYRAAARTLRNWPEPISELIKEHGVAGLMRLPAIG